jgi:hypothetical protein
VQVRRNPRARVLPAHDNLTAMIDDPAQTSVQLVITD